MGRGHRVTDVSYYLSEPTLSCKTDTAVVMPLCPIGFAEFSTLRGHHIVGKTDSVMELPDLKINVSHYLFSWSLQVSVTSRACKWNESRTYGFLLWVHLSDYC